MTRIKYGAVGIGLFVCRQLGLCKIISVNIHLYFQSAIKGRNENTVSDSPNSDNSGS